MNNIDVRVFRINGMFGAQFKRVHKASYETVEANGQPILFANADKAEVAGWRAMTAHITTLMRRDGETVSTDVFKAAEAIFKGDSDGKSGKA